MSMLHGSNLTELMIQVAPDRSLSQAFTSATAGFGLAFLVVLASLAPCHHDDLVDILSGKTDSPRRGPVTMHNYHQPRSSSIPRQKICLFSFAAESEQRPNLVKYFIYIRSTSALIALTT